METMTRVVPKTRMTTETKTRSVPVTKTRTETKQIKQADGSFKNITVNVPYTEQVAQSYTVQVPVQENVTQTFQVPVPYTADGKPIAKSDYGKYGLNAQGQRGDSQGARKNQRFAGQTTEVGQSEFDDDSEAMDFPDADTWRDEQTPRTHFDNLRLADPEDGDGLGDDSLGNQAV